MKTTRRYGHPLALCVMLALGVLLGPWVRAFVPTGPVQAQGDPPLSVLVITSATSVQPNAQFSLSVSVSTTSTTVRPITAQLVLTGAPATITQATSPCTVNGLLVSCPLSISQDAPATITAQVVPSAAGTLTASATAQGGDDMASTEAVTITVAGDALPTSVPTSIASATVPAASTALATPSQTAPTATPTSTQTAATQTPTLTATALPPGSAPDACEPNNTLVQPCALQTESDIGDLTFVDGTPDVYSFLLKGGRTYTIRAASTTGIDPVLTVYLAGALQTPLATNDDAATGDTAAALQVTTATDAWYIVEVTNKAPGDMHAKTYTLSVRSSVPVATTPLPGATASISTTTTPTAPTGDALENDYSTDTAARLSWGVPYDLSLVCPQPHACVSGDHDFYWVPVKAGIPIVAVTYDLGPGADTIATFYRPDATQQDEKTGPVGWRPVVSNDDIAPGWSLRSQLPLAPNWDGYALLVVAPSERQDPPPIPNASGPVGRYRLIVGSPEMAAVQTVLNAQTDGPPITPTAPPTVAPTSQAAAPIVAPTAVRDARDVVKEPSITGQAVVVADGAAFYSAVPPTDGDLLAHYPEGAEVELLGQAYAGFVKVQPADSVAPGWMFAPSLRPMATTPAPSGPGAGGAPGTNGTPGTNDTPRTGIGDGSSLTSTPADGTSETVGPLTPQPTDVLPPLAIDPLDPLPLPTAPSVAPQARSLTVTTCIATASDTRTCATAIANLTVEVVQVATQQVVATARTDRNGQVSLSMSVAPNAQLLVRVPALGVSVVVDANTTTVPVRMPPQTTGATP